MNMKYGILILAIIVCVAGGVYATGLSSNPTITGIVSTVLGSNHDSDPTVQNDPTTVTDTNISTSADNGTTIPNSNSNSENVPVKSNINNNVDVSNDNEPEETQTIYLNEDNISNNDNGSIDPGYVRPNGTIGIISINGTVLA
jgi:hypothetical protein